MSQIKSLSVMLVKKLRVISYLIPNLSVFLVILSSGVYLLRCLGSYPHFCRRKKKYYVSFIDDFSKFTWIYLLKYKQEVFLNFHEFQSMFERLFDRKIIAMQADWGISKASRFL